MWGDDHDRQVIPVSGILPKPLFCLHTAQQREITPAAGLTLYTVVRRSGVRGGGRGTVWGDDHDRQVIPVSGILPKPLFCLHTAQQREITPAAGLTLYTVVRRKHEWTSHMITQTLSAPVPYHREVCTHCTVKKCKYITYSDSLTQTLSAPVPYHREVYMHCTVKKCKYITYSDSPTQTLSDPYHREVYMHCTVKKEM